MSLGKRKTRGSDTHCFGSIAELPDDGDLFTHKDIIAAAFHMLEHNHELSSYLVADALVPKIKLKWNQVNPKLVIIRDESIRIKIIRDVKFCQKIKSHKVSKKQKEVF